jgi:hypothetical protein
VPPDDITENEKIFEGLSQTVGAIRRTDSVIPVINIDRFLNIYHEKPAEDKAEHGVEVRCTQDL